MIQYTNAEMADMHLVYGLAKGSTVAAAKLYAEKFPNRRLPCCSTFSQLHRNLREYGTFWRRPEAMPKRTTRTAPVEEVVPREEKQNTHTSDAEEDMVPRVEKRSARASAVKEEIVPRVEKRSRTSAVAKQIVPRGKKRSTRSKANF